MKFSENHNKTFEFVLAVRGMAGHGPKIMPMTPSRFQWHKFKDSLHYFTMVGLIPMSALIFYVNVFIGPAQLTEVPEGYEPEHWEYHRVSFVKVKRHWRANGNNQFIILASNHEMDGALRLPISSAGIRKNVTLHLGRAGEDGRAPNGEADP
jgi:NADH:ubiquinone oxidoreductase, NDUFB5/SGDH subunit